MNALPCPLYHDRCSTRVANLLRRLCVNVGRSGHFDKRPKAAVRFTQFIVDDGVVSDDEQPELTLAHDVFEQFHAYAGSAILIGEVDDTLATACSLVVVPTSRGVESRMA
ncbi:hypothetical protein [Devosia nitrariae]|uniref:hypothetical protein n=1 Tax=Devosia nitrariae TaxID=2071872 RepID=UPI0024E0D3AF|nr:hypothetical protein [Devosia nitrariae]